MNLTFNKDYKYTVKTVYSDKNYDCEILEFAKNSKTFSAKLGEVYFDTGRNSSNTILLGLGEEKKLTDDNLRIAGYKLVKSLNQNKIDKATLHLPTINNLTVCKSIAEGLLQATYKFDKFLSTKKEDTLEEISLINSCEDGVEEAKTLIEGIFLARDLVNEPAMYLYPETLANTAKEKLTSVGVEVEILDKNKIEEIGMTAFLSVAIGSDKEPKFIIMRYNGNPESKEKYAFVGKGLTYDSGGYCIKSPSSMKDMHCDMGGSATVIGAMYSIAKAKLKANVVAVVAACENLISGKAYKTGDIIGSLSGKTIEVGNTDAEGRLTLADALYYVADNENPTAIIDFATLTGACVVALGEVFTGAITNNQDLYNKVLEASKKSGEKVWQLPSDDEYRELIKSETADLSNIGVRGAGCITAGLFLENFVKDIPWVHMDIAGTAYTSAPIGYLPKGATGIHVKTLYNLVK